MFELYPTKDGWRISTGDGNRNQTSRIFNYLMSGKSLNRYQSVYIDGGIKLASRVSEINDALTESIGIEVNSVRVDTRFRGFYFVYNLTSEQRDQIKQSYEVTA